MMNFRYFDIYTSEQVLERLEKIIAKEAGQTDILKQNLPVMEDASPFKAIKGYVESKDQPKEGTLIDGTKYTISIDPYNKEIIHVQVINSPHRKSPFVFKISYKGHIPPKD